MQGIASSKTRKCKLIPNLEEIDQKIDLAQQVLVIYRLLLKVAQSRRVTRLQPSVDTNPFTLAMPHVAKKTTIKALQWTPLLKVFIR